MDATAKYLMKEIGPAQTIWARYTVHAILVAVLILPKINIYGKTKYPKLQFLRSVALMMATTLFFFAFSKLGLAEASAIFNISPVLITLGAFLFLREQIGPRRVIGIFVSLLAARQPETVDSQHVFFIHICLLAALKHVELTVFAHLHFLILVEGFSSKVLLGYRFR